MIENQSLKSGLECPEYTHHHTKKSKTIGAQILIPAIPFMHKIINLLIESLLMSFFLTLEVHMSSISVPGVDIASS